ncbi:SPOR domain-containing protein [Shewanella sp.]|uniref:SPOR domain-containing protein n=1 Tax=Shewanella sp. TaxID=50422 RepID=UPI001ECF9A1C|nr:SPOR domain-containing protein [Shewanella sp.]NRB23578.1 SPOR domain-containing protein [Shewanella sp.]
MANMSQNIKRILFKQFDLHCLRLSAFMLASFCFSNCFADDVSLQRYDNQRFEALSLKFEQHLKEWEEWKELRPAIKRLVSSEADLEFLITELSKMSKLKANPTAEQLNNEKDIFVVNKETVNGQSKLSVKKSVSQNEAAENNLVVTNVKSFIDSRMTNVEQGEQFSIHLASFVRLKNVQSSWLSYQARYPGLLKDLLPYSTDIIKGETRYRRLLAGVFKSKKHAQEVCAGLKKSNQYCRAVKYNGESMIKYY